MTACIERRLTPAVLSIQTPIPLFLGRSLWRTGLRFLHRLLKGRSSWLFFERGSRIGFAVGGDFAGSLVAVEAIFGGLRDVGTGVEAGSQLAEALPKHGVGVAVTDLG